MRFVVLVKATKASEAGMLPTREQLDELGQFNDEFSKAGVLLAADGLQATSKARVCVSPAAKPPLPTARSPRAKT
jgi:hypothetical protein